MAKRVHWSKEIANLDQIETAISYTAHFRKGPFEKYTIEAGTLAEARHFAAGLTARHGQYGRGACVYGITPSGLTVLIPAHYSPAG